MPGPPPFTWFEIRAIGPDRHRNGLPPLAPGDRGPGRATLMVFNTHWHCDRIMRNPKFEVVGISGLESDLIRHPIENPALMRL